jgi:hypothetical protein
MLVKELIAELQRGNPEAEIVRLGHFGEHFQFSKGDFWWFGHPNQKYDDLANCKFLQVDCPDIGEEPE